MINNRYKRYWNFYKNRIVGLVLLNIVFTAFSFLTMLIDTKFLNNLYVSINMELIWRYIVIVSFLKVTSMIFNFIYSLFYSRLERDVSYSINRELLDHVQKLPINFFYKLDTDYIISRITSDSDKVATFILNDFIGVIVSIISFLISIVLIITLDIKMLYIIVSILILYTITYKKFENILYKSEKKLVESSDEFNSLLYDQLRDIKITKINILFSKLKKELDNGYEKLLITILNNIKKHLTFDSVFIVLDWFFQIIVFLYAGSKVIAGMLGFGEIFLILRIYNKSIEYIDNLLRISQSYPSFKVSLDRINNLFNMKKENNGDKKLKLINSISLENIIFNYGKTEIINNFNYMFKKERIYLIKGHNGSGKTTLVDLILGLKNFDYSGIVKYNGINIKDIDLYNLRKNLVSVVTQDVNLEKIAYYTDRYSTEEINRIKVMSGGEKQKYAINNILKKGSDLVIFDEPTSSLDIKNKTELKDMIYSLRKDKIIIIITHDDVFDSIADSVIELGGRNV